MIDYEKYSEGQNRKIKKVLTGCNLMQIGGALLGGWLVHIAIDQGRKLGFHEGIKATDLALRKIGLWDETMRREEELRNK